MKFILAPDSFKESMSAAEAADAMERGVRSVFADAEVIAMPMADGGEGLTEILTKAMGGELVEVEVCGPMRGKPGYGQVREGYAGAPGKGDADAAGLELDAPELAPTQVDEGGCASEDASPSPASGTTMAKFGWIEDRRSVVIECAEACGIHLVPQEQRDPMKANTYGVGQLIAKALDYEPDTIIFGLGGSATNDGGAGMLQALGARLFDAEGEEIGSDDNPIAHLAGGRLDLSKLDRRLASTKFVAACDVDNPLTGPNGASAIFGPQKGADPKMVQVLDEALGEYGALLEAALGSDLADVPGTGAAGGLGIAILGPLDGKLERGIEVVLDSWRIDEALPGTDFVFTGEGKIDGQTRQGKTPWGVAKRAAQFDVPTIAFAGKLGSDWESLTDTFHDMVQIASDDTDLATALAQGPQNLEASVAQVCQCLKDA